MWANPLKHSCTCWICLEESTFNSSWIRHECGCNLQVHKLCYLHWLYRLNEDYIARTFSTKNAILVSEDNLRRTMCYLVDGHKHFQRNVSLADIYYCLPFIKAKNSGSLAYPISVINILGINYSISFKLVRIPTVLPIAYAECPQCKKHIVNHQVSVTSGSMCLKVFYWSKMTIRSITIAITLAISTMNIGKWWFKLGLWQMRWIFPEKVLRVILDISTTKALDVYSETMGGISSVPQLTRLLIFGFPVYLMGIRSSFSALSRFRWLYSLLLAVRAGHYDSQNTKVLSRTLATCNICSLVHSILISPMLSRLYEYMVKSVNPYFYLTEPSLDVYPSQEYENVIIKTSWCDVLFESVVWPALGSILGGKLFDAATCLQHTLGFQWSPAFSPNDCRMIFNFVGCGVTAIARQLLNIWATHLRVNELKQLQKSLEDEA